MSWFDPLYRGLMRAIERMGPQEWVLALGGLVLVSWICLKGFGSRSSY